MNEPIALFATLQGPARGRPFWHEAAAVAGRLATLLRAEGGGEASAPWGRALAFIVARRGEAARGAPAPAPQPLDDLSRALGLGDDERTLLVLSAMADEHEGYGAIFAALHPRGESRPTWGLFCRLLADDAGHDPGREATRQLLHRSPLLRLGLVHLVGDAPVPERSLRLCDGLAGALHGSPAWPDGLAPLPANPWLDGLDDWLAQPNSQHALTMLQGTDPGLAASPTVLLRGLQPSAVRLRAQQLAAARGGLVFEWDATRDATELSALLGHVLLRRALPVLLAEAPLPPAHWALLDACPLPLVLAGASVGQAAPSQRALLMLDAPPLAPPAQARLWARALPELADHAALLTARYPVGPETLAHLRRDLAPWLGAGGRPTLERCVAALKARMQRADESFARRVQPIAGWADLVLPPDKLAPLQEAVARFGLQHLVLDDWGFGRHARSSRGLRLLFSGLPGTGKTLAAEVVAQALHADLLVIDLARLVSKWIGETEKNLAAAFDQAEGTGAVLFFDEADALFGKRTEVGDAHDRYANIESAYLLARLERFEGVAILATNLRGNLDRAFLRRFEAAIDFAEPGPAERAAIWRRQFPPAAPLAADLDFDQLGALHALPGALIRNASLSAAFIAAAAGQRIGRSQVESALRREYDKAGRVAPT